MWKEVNLLSTNFSAKHTPSTTFIYMKKFNIAKMHAVHCVFQMSDLGVPHLYAVVEFLPENSVSLVHQTCIKGTGNVITCKFLWTGYDLEHCSCEPWTTSHIWLYFKYMNCQKNSDMTQIEKNILNIWIP